MGILENGRGCSLHHSVLLINGVGKFGERQAADEQGRPSVPSLVAPDRMSVVAVVET
jgi:hypothetical protein